MEYFEAQDAHPPRTTDIVDLSDLSYLVCVSLFPNVD
jgi:hypothetical protein